MIVEYIVSLVHLLFHVIFSLLVSGRSKFTVDEHFIFFGCLVLTRGGSFLQSCSLTFILF